MGEIQLSSLQHEEGNRVTMELWRSNSGRVQKREATGGLKPWHKGGAGRLLLVPLGKKEEENKLTVSNRLGGWASMKN